MFKRPIRVDVGETVEREGFAYADLLSSPKPRSVPPVRLVTSATILPASASISSSVIVFSRGWIVTAMAIGFLARIDALAFIDVEHGRRP